MNITKKDRIGVWGFGVSGKAAVSYFLAQGNEVGVMDKKIFIGEEAEYFKKHNVAVYTQEEKEKFFSLYDFLFISPGINIENDYATLQSKYVNELDFFASQCNKKSIAITGSIGKTSITHILSSLFSAVGISAAVGGNIGTASFDLLPMLTAADCALLEVSSFQLNYCTTFAPDLAIWTNFYPNHLDYHRSENEYFCAKTMILVNQTEKQWALLPFELRNRIPEGRQQRAYFTTQPIDHDQLRTLKTGEQLYYISKNIVMRYSNGMHSTLFSLASIPLFSFIDNILIIISACSLLDIDTAFVTAIAPTILLPEHRLEKIPSTIGIDFYNDSKGTTTISTQRAVEKLHAQPIHLFLGGLSKGIDRTNFVSSLSNTTKRIYCFGVEADALYAMCIKYSIAAEKHCTLTDAFNSCIKRVQSGECVLFSPSGSSYDLYNNYQERGNHFKQLVSDFIKKGST